MTALVRRCGTYWAHMALALLDTDEEPVVVDQSISRRGRSPVVEEVFDIGREAAPGCNRARRAAGGRFAGPPRRCRSIAAASAGDHRAGVEPAPIGTNWAASSTVCVHRNTEQAGGNRGAGDADGGILPHSPASRGSNRAPMGERWVDRLLRCRLPGAQSGRSGIE
jgi:hypothetical protein